jgi:transposase
MTNYREILRLSSLGINNKQIAEGMGIARQTVVTALQRAAAQGLDWPTAEPLSDRELATRLFPQGDGKPAFKIPDYEAVHKELAKPGVTQQLLWFEYCDKCRATGEIPYQLTQFKTLYREYVVKTKATMHINRKPGEIMEVDWAGQTAFIVDSDTGEALDAYLFVAALPYSGYAYAEAFMDQKQDAWTAAHVNAYNFFGGVTRILVPDNLKTGVIKHTKSELVLNRTYQELVEHYGTAIIPARVRTPKDKATVEGTVGIVSTFILAAIRDQKFFTLRELNDVIRERLHTLNHKPFQKKDGSRALLFAEERISLLPLPRNTYEMASWKTAKVSFNYHIEVDGRFYSVPYEYIKRQVDVRVTRGVVEVFFEGIRICSHVRLYDKDKYSTQEAHMPPNHQQYTQWNGDRFRKWAAKIGPQTACVIESILTGYKVEQQGYRACMALLKLSDSYTPERLEAACDKALFYTPRPSYKSIQTILKSGGDRSPESPTPTAPSTHGFTRGADYYGRGGRK